jgi:hypothetical protein
MLLLLETARRVTQIDLVYNKPDRSVVMNYVFPSSVGWMLDDDGG